MSAHHGIAVVGASIAGVAAADAVRSGGYDGPVWLIDRQPDQPYDRPPLSKKSLLDGAAPVPLRAADHWLRQRFDLLLGRAGTALRAAERTLVLDDGTELSCAAIVLAPGADPRPLPFPVGGFPVQLLRTAADARRLSATLDRVRSLTVIGAGFIGLEVAAAARQHQIDVTVVEAVTDPLADAIGAPAAQFLLDAHRAAGTRLLAGRSVSEVRPADGGATVLLNTGEELRTEAVVAGIGVRPAVDWLTGSGLALHNGIVADAALRTDAAGIYACGDAASWPNPVYRRRMRVEHWTTAREQGAHAGAAAARFALTGETSAPFAHVPYVWSDQLGHKVQMVGCLLPGAQTVLERCDERGMLASHYLGDRLIGRTGINAPRQVMPTRRQIHVDCLNGACDECPPGAAIGTASDAAASAAGVASATLEGALS